jgi:hypothetical protein
MDLLKRNRATSDDDRARPAGNRPAQGPDDRQPTGAPDDPSRGAYGQVAEPPPAAPDRTQVAGAHAYDRNADPALGVDRRVAGPHERVTERTPATADAIATTDATDPRGTPPARRSRWHGRRHPVGDEVVVRHWSIADAVVTLVGAALAVVGAVGLARAEVDSTWYEPVVRVARADHTPLLAAAELGAGVLLVLVGVARRRALATLLGVALAVGAAVLALQADEVATELAIDRWWAWTLCGAGAVVALMAAVPRRARIERVDRTAGPAHDERLPRRDRAVARREPTRLA